MTLPTADPSPAVPPATEARYPYWGVLTPGPHAAGFRARWLWDHARVYAPPWAEGLERPPKRFRPILMAAWYPAAAGSPTMRYRAYLEPSAGDPEQQEFARQLFAFNLNEYCRYGFRKPQAVLDAGEQAVPEQWLDTPTPAVPDAAPAAGRFPLILYHPGLGGSYEDNAGLCEYLATHGYVVLSSAYPPENAASLGIDSDYDRSFRDLRFLMNAAGALSNADLDRVAVMGHSYGALAASAFRAENASAVDAVVSLDSTVETCPPGHEQHRRTHPRLAPVGRFSVPMLLVSGKMISVDQNNQLVDMRPPSFEAYEGLQYARRWYATVAHLDHHQFASSAVMWRPVRTPDWVGMAGPETVRSTFAMLCRTIRRFLDASLKGDGAAEAALQAQAAGAKEEPIVLQNREAVPLPPSPEQLARIAAGGEGGVARAAALHARFGEAVSEEDLIQAANLLRERRQPREAIALLQLALERAPDSPAAHSALGDTYRELNDRDPAIRSYRAALARIPQDDPRRRSHAEWALRELGAPAPAEETG